LFEIWAVGDAVVNHATFDEVRRELAMETWGVPVDLLANSTRVGRGASSRLLKKASNLKSEGRSCKEEMKIQPDLVRLLRSNL
jgi:hypothetical protein